MVIFFLIIFFIICFILCVLDCKKINPWEININYKRIDLISKYVAICLFPAILYSFFSQDNQSKLVKDEIFTSTTVSILQLVSQAKWQNDGGNRSSYLILNSLRGKLQDDRLKKTLELQIENLKNSYEGIIVETFVENLPTVCKFITTSGKQPCSEGLETKNNFQIHNLIDHLNPRSHPLWAERARAAYLLRFLNNATDIDNYKEKIKKEEIYEVLIDRLKEENEVSLLVTKMAFETYKSLRGFEPKSKDGFAFKAAIEDWEIRKKGFQK